MVMPPSPSPELNHGVLDASWIPCTSPHRFCFCPRPHHHHLWAWITGKNMIMSLSCLSRKQCHHIVLKIRLSLFGLPCGAPREYTLLTLPSESSPSPPPLPPHLQLPCMPFWLVLPIVSWTSPLAFPWCVPPPPFLCAFLLFV